jgi:hypothetical protein
MKFCSPLPVPPLPLSSSPLILAEFAEIKLTINDLHKSKKNLQNSVKS